jgi:hypothetical protein
MHQPEPQGDAAIAAAMQSSFGTVFTAPESCACTEAHGATAPVATAAAAATVASIPGVTDQLARLALAGGSASTPGRLYGDPVPRAPPTVALFPALPRSGSSPNAAGNGPAAGGAAAAAAAAAATALPSRTSRHIPIVIPTNLVPDFMRFAARNTAADVETCATLCGKKRDGQFHITMVIAPISSTLDNVTFPFLDESTIGCKCFSPPPPSLPGHSSQAKGYGQYRGDVE